MRHSRLSLNVLRAFEAAGRHLSFKKAAEELHVSPAAVGHQVKTLEDALGTRLLVRLNRAIELTEAGHELLSGLTDVFHRLSVTLDTFHQRSSRRSFKVSVEPSFAAKWLIRRLDRFQKLHSGMNLRIDATARQVDFSREPVDIAIRYGTGEYKGLLADRLFNDSVMPVCSPKLLEGVHPLRTPKDLCHHVLLHCEPNPKYPSWPSWDTWLKAAGLDNIEPNKGLEFSVSSYPLLLQAAIEGQGVGLASNIHVVDDLAVGRLIKPFDLSLPLSFGYFVVYPERTAESPEVRAFRDWVLEEARDSETL